MTVLEGQLLVKEYEIGEERLAALSEVSLSIERAEFLAIMGPSGSGKSTLLHLLSTLERPTSGTVAVLGEEVTSMSDDGLALLRRRRLGFVFQFFNLLPNLCAWENVAVPSLLDGARLATCRDRAIELLGLMNIDQRAEHRPAQLSGGEMQRVAIARALMNEPLVLFADEPTGNLDSVTGHAVLDLLRERANDGQTIVMVTHDRRTASVADRVVHLRDGQLCEPQD